MAYFSSAPQAGIFGEDQLGHLVMQLINNFYHIFSVNYINLSLYRSTTCNQRLKLTPKD